MVGRSVFCPLSFTLLRAAERSIRSGIATLIETTMPITHISVRGARQHNLRDINVRIPRNTLTVVTGLSGSGKSSLAFDTIYAEGQRRYVETLSAYARQFLDQIERPDVDSIEGLSLPSPSSRRPPAAVPLHRRHHHGDLRYLRLLYASIGTPHCPNCAGPSRADGRADRGSHHGTRPRRARHRHGARRRGRKGEFKDLLDQLDQQGFRARVDGEMQDLSEPLLLDRRKNHTIEAVIDASCSSRRRRPRSRQLCWVPRVCPELVEGLASETGDSKKPLPTGSPSTKPP